MSISTRKAGYLSVAAMTFALLAGSESTGALAQEAELAPTPVTPVAAVANVQFVTEPVVQEASEEAIAEDKAANEAAAEAEAELEIANVNASSLRDMVDKMPQGARLNSQMRCLASAIYFESRGEPLAGQLAVAKVIMNRAESRQFPNSYCAVVKQRSQFSFVRGGRIPTPNKGTNAWKRAKAIAMIADQDLWNSAAGDSLYFHATYVRPSWARKKSQRARINTHIFYR